MNQILSERKIKSCNQGDGKGRVVFRGRANRLPDSREDVGFYVFAHLYRSRSQRIEMTTFLSIPQVYYNMNGCGDPKQDDRTFKIAGS